MVRFQIQLEEGQAALLKEAAARRHVSAAAVIRKALEGELALEPRPTFSEVVLALKEAGKLGSGPGDLSERHDDYFAEAIDDWH